MVQVVHDVYIQASTRQFYKVISGANLSNLPRSCPETIPQVELLGGAWGQKRYRMRWHFGLGSIWNLVFDLPHVVVLEYSDGDNMIVKFKVVEGYLLNYLPGFKFTVQTMQGRSVRWTIEYDNGTENHSGTIRSLVERVTQEIVCHL